MFEEEASGFSYNRIIRIYRDSNMFSQWHIPRESSAEQSPIGLISKTSVISLPTAVIW